MFCSCRKFTCIGLQASTSAGTNSSDPLGPLRLRTHDCWCMEFMGTNSWVKKHCSIPGLELYRTVTSHTQISGNIVKLRPQPVHYCIVTLPQRQMLNLIFEWSPPCRQLKWRFLMAPPPKSAVSFYRKGQYVFFKTIHQSFSLLTLFFLITALQSFFVWSLFIMS